MANATPVHSKSKKEDVTEAPAAQPTTQPSLEELQARIAELEAEKAANAANAKPAVTQEMLANAPTLPISPTYEHNKDWPRVWKKPDGTVVQDN